MRSINAIPFTIFGIIVLSCSGHEFESKNADCAKYSELYQIIGNVDHLVVATAESYQGGEYKLGIIDTMLSSRIAEISLSGISPGAYEGLSQKEEISFDYAHEPWNSLLGTQAFGFICPLAPFSPPPYVERVRSCHLFLEIDSSYLIGFDHGVPILAVPVQGNEELISCAQKFKYY